MKAATNARKKMSFHCQFERNHHTEVALVRANQRIPICQLFSCHPTALNRTRATEARGGHDFMNWKHSEAAFSRLHLERSEKDSYKTSSPF
jgi:hypothetical protein